jgi:hypothetical protein
MRAETPPFAAPPTASRRTVDEVTVLARHHDVDLQAAVEEKWLRRNPDWIADSTDRLQDRSSDVLALVWSELESLVQLLRRVASERESRADSLAG